MQDFDKLRSKINKIISNEHIANLIMHNDSLKTIVEEYNTALIELEIQSDELKQTQANLESEKQKFKEFFQNSPVAFVILDANSNIVDINNAAINLLEIKNRNFSSNPFITRLVTSDLPKLYSYIQEVINSNSTIKSDFSLIFEDNRKKRIEFNSTKFTEPTSEKVLIRTILVDITERYEQQLQIEEIHQQLTSMLMSGNMAWWRMNLKTMSADYHPLKAQLLGYTVEEFSNDVYKIMSFVHPDDYQASWDAMKNHLEGNAPTYEIIYRMRCKDGSYKWILDRGRIAQYDENGNPELVIGIFTDVTEFKQMEMNLLTEKEKMENANEAKTKLVSVLSHDLRSPYATIINYLDLLKERYDSFDDTKKKEIIDIVYQTTKGSLNLLEDLLEWARCDSDSIQIEYSKIEVNGFLRQQLDVFENAAKLKNITFQVNGEKNLMIKTDLNLLSSIVRNLLSNAIKFSRINSQVQLNYYQSGDKIVFAIKDEGIGMNERQISNLFKITNSASRTGTAGERGTGFGLKIVKEYIKKLQGEIWLNSKINVGTTFYFSLPIN